MSSQMVTVKRTDRDGTVHTYAWPKSLAELDDQLEIVNEKPETADGYRKPAVDKTEPGEQPGTGEPVVEPAKPTGKPVTEPKPKPDVKES